MTAAYAARRSGRPASSSCPAGRAHAAQRADRDRRAPARRAAGRAAAAGAVRPGPPGPRARCSSQTLLSGTETMTTCEIAAELQKVGGGLSAGRRPGPADDLRQRPGHRAGPAAGAAGRGADRRHLPRRRGRHRAGPAGRPDPGGAEPAGAPGPGGAAASGCTAGTRTRCRRRSRSRSAAVRPAALRALHAERVHPAGAMLVLVGDMQPEKALDAAERALAGWTGRRAPAELPPGAAAGAGAAAAGRPARLGAVLAAAGAAGGAAHPPRPCRAATGQPGLRRLLLLPVGGEHPRGQGLHLRPALGDRAFRRRVRCWSSPPTWPPR